VTAAATQLLARSPRSGTAGRWRWSVVGRDLLIAAGALVAWQLLAWTVFAGTYTFVGPIEIIQELRADPGLYGRNLRQTGVAALWAFLLGNLVAVVLAGVVLVVPLLRRAVQDFSFIVSCLPLVAIAPILRVTLGPGDSTPIAVGALAVVYTSLTACLVGLRSAELGALDVVAAGGRGRLFALIHVRARAAVPALFAGLQISAPAAFLGVMVGEFTGASSGFGQLTIRALATLDPARVWTVAAVAAFVSTVAFVAIGAIGRWLSPWAADTSTAPPPIVSRRALRAVGFTVSSIVFVLAMWVLLLEVSNLNEFFAKGPADVWRFLVTDADAAANRQQVIGPLVETLTTAGLGFVVGLVGAVALAGLVVTFPPVGRVVTPVAVALRAAPVVATTPLVILLVGRGLLGAVAVTAILSFFPTLVACTAAMRRVPGQVDDVMRSFAAGRLALFFGARLPASLPALAASARIAVPASLLGATVVEWLATGDGMGTLLANAANLVQYDLLWSAVAVLVLVAVLAYGVVGVIESFVLARFAPGQRA